MAWSNLFWKPLAVSVGVAIFRETIVVTLDLQHFHIWICSFLCECDGSRAATSTSKLVKLVLRDWWYVKIGDITACLQLFCSTNNTIDRLKAFNPWIKSLGYFSEGFQAFQPLEFGFLWWRKMIGVPQVKGNAIWSATAPNTAIPKDFLRHLFMGRGLVKLY